MRSQEVEETRPRKLAVISTFNSRFMKSIPISEIELARSVRGLMNLKETGVSYGDSPATLYLALIVFPCVQDRTARYQDTVAEIPVKYRAQVIKGQPPQVYLRSLPDGKYRKWTRYNHVILREWGIMVAFLETIAASKEDWEERIKDQLNENEDEIGLLMTLSPRGLASMAFY